MGIWQRISQLIRSNVNDLISRAEDPEKMLNQVIIDMNNQLIKAKKQVATAIADEKRLYKQLEAELANVREWKQKAMLAVKAGNDALAKEALLRKREHEKLAEEYRKQWEAQKQAVEQLKLQLRRLNDKIEEAKRKKNLLIAKKKRAEAQKTIQQTMAGLTDTSAFEVFERMEQKIEKMEAEAEATAEIAQEMTGDVLKQKFEELEATSGADEELLALKKEMGLIKEEAPKEEKKEVEEVEVGVEAELEELKKMMNK